MRRHGVPREQLSVQAQIDRATKELVRSVKPLLEESGLAVPRTRTIAGHFAEPFYVGTTAALEALGFRLLGDFDATDERAEHDLFTRLLLARDGGAFAKILAAPADGDFGEIRAVALGTRFDDRSSVVTWLNWPPRIPSPPQFQEWFVDGDIPLVTVLAAHRTHVQRAGKAVQAFETATEILDQWKHEERETVAWRRKLGIRFYEMFIRSVTGEHFDTSGRVMLEAIRAHPWWLTGGRAA